jgi:periplasmic protein TonB
MMQTARADGPVGAMTLLGGHRRARRMAPVVMLVIGLHVALLSVPVRSGAMGHALPADHSLQVRMVVAPAAATVDRPTVPTVATTTDSLIPVDARLALAPLQAPTVSEPTPLPEPALEPAALAATDVSPPLSVIGLLLPGVDSDDDYFPRALLSLVPSPIDPVQIDYPASVNDSSRHVSELTLFIDETGRVARVRVDGDALPPALEEAARAAFVNARFRAGESQGRIVKSRIRIEVVFDSRPPAPERSAALAAAPRS